MNRHTRLALLILLTLAVSTVSARPRVDDDCGAAVEGLQMCLASSGANLQVALRNASDHDLTLNLGIILGNGKTQSPHFIAIKFTDSQGQTRLFKFYDKRYSGVAGRVDDYIVPLRIGATYTMQFTLDQFWCQETTEYSIPLLSGQNYLTAEFEGTSPNSINSDMAGTKYMKFWLGKVNSNTLTLRR